MNITFPCPTCGRPLHEYLHGSFMCGAEDCKDCENGVYYTLDDLLRGLFRWSYEGAEPTAKIGDIGHAKQCGMGRGWGWTAKIGKVRLVATHQGGSIERECEREVIAYLRGKMAEGPGDTE